MSASRLQSPASRVSSKRRWTAWVLPLIVAGLVGFGAWKWSARRAVERTATLFLEAMVQGDAETLLAQLDGPALENFLAKSPAEQQDFATPIAGARYEIRQVHLKTSSAKVRVLWKVSGFDIWSELELVKAPMGRWKIHTISDPEMIPSWEQVRWRIEEESKGASAPIDKTLSKKLKDREGVEVRPLTEGELDQSPRVRDPGNDSIGPEGNREPNE